VETALHSYLDITFGYAARVRLAVLLLLLPGSALAGDDTLVAFPTYAVKSGEKLLIDVHAWVYEPETGSLKRGVGVEQLAAQLEVKPEQRPVFDRRVRAFLVDNERGERVQVEVGDESFELGRTADDGHVEKTIELKAGSQASLPLRVKMDDLVQDLVVPVLGPTGTSVVSDIDDTIKVTEVLDKRKLLANTFLEEFRAVEGMAKRYARWADEGMSFHYLSASPWQLESELRTFVSKSGFPDGPLHLRKARTNSLSTPLVLMEGSRDHKLAELRRLLGRFPQRTFILVGDSGEQDPEIYGEIARAAPKQVVRIYIRLVGEDSKERWNAAFKGVAAKWKIFRDPAELE
jgi:phosphatidate phosphatase APP1